MRREPHERVYLDSRRHGIVLLPSLLRGLVVAVAGGFLISLGWPFPVAGAALVAAAAFSSLRAVWMWERTRVIATDERLALVRGTFRRRTAAVRLQRVGAVEIEQSVLGRLFGYGTLIAGPLEITYVPQPRSLDRLVSSIS